MAKKKYPRSASLQTTTETLGSEYVGWNAKKPGSVKAAMAEFGKSLDNYRGVQRSHGAFQDYSDLAPNVSGRPGLTREDYGRFRPAEAVPEKIKDIIKQSDIIYRRVGLIKNIIDLMGDFACQGIRLVHPNKRVEKFYRNWWTRVNGTDRSERFLNNLYRTGNVIVRRQTAKISVKSAEKLHKSIGKPDTQIIPMKVDKREIPWRYVFLDPTTVEVVGGPLASFVGKPIYAVKLPDNIRRLIRNAKTPEELALIKELPDEIKRAARGRGFWPLDSEKTKVYHYKKDDWHPWAFPMIYSIMDDIVLLEKLKLADIAALDGAISNIRIFKIGSLEHQIAPNPVAAAKLAEILESHTGVGTMDFVWGPDLEMIESTTTVHQFLGEEKYRPALTNIYAGMGVPGTLTGTLGAAGTTNNLISIKTLIQRLEYGRKIIENFWNEESARVQLAMGFRFPAKVEFSWSSLGDEASERALLIQMADRNLISDELFQHFINNDPEMERIRLNRENLEREKGRMVPKAGAFHDPQFGVALKKVALQTGVLTPAETGIRKDEVRKDLKKYEKEPGEKNALEMRAPPGGQPKKKGQPQQGRPKNSNDKTKRKTKTFSPKNKAVVEVWAQAAQAAIADVLNPGFLDQFDKKNMRSLTTGEHEASEKIKFGVLCHLDPLGTIDEASIQKALNKGNVPADVYETYNEWTENVSSDLQRKLTLDELKVIQAALYASFTGENDG